MLTSRVIAVLKTTSAHALLLLVVAFLFVACPGTDASEAPSLQQVDPSWGLSDRPTEVTLRGTFPPEIRVSYATGKRTAVNVDYRVVFGSVDLTGVDRVDRHTIVATVPSGMAIGQYDVSMIDPTGRSSTLNAAFQIIDEPPCVTDTACIDVCRSTAACLSGVCHPGPVDKDSDGDGFIDAACPGGDDCDDNCADCWPGAAEVSADGIDQDCDGFDACFRDLDGDGSGTTVVVTDNDLDCSNASSSEAATNDDCDDADPLVFPGSACDDGDTCTTGTTCTAGVCGGGTNTCCLDSCGGGCGGTGNCCAETCSDGGCNSCASGCTCDFSCVGVSDCSTDCASGSTCTMVADTFSDIKTTCIGGTCKLDCRNSSGRCRLDCHANGDCELTCNNVDICRMDCFGNAICRLECNDATACELNACSSPTDCGGGVWTCNRACP
ncbi:MAG: hypothetical protein V3T05_13825, partial [Myxococcota bacterium]